MTTSDLRIGCCGFPQPLERYAQTFAVVEVQQTFYQPPLLRTLVKWRACVPDGFEFTLKAWQLITHDATSPTYRRLREKLSDQQRREAGSFRLNSTVLSAWQRTLECARALGSRAILFQCPARFAPSRENKGNLREFLRQVHSGLVRSPGKETLTFVWEPRGEWNTEEVRELCEELDLIHGIDPFQQQPATSGLGYYRLHGKTGYRYQYSDADLRQLLEFAQSRPFCYVLFNNLSMLEDARRFMRLTREAA